MVTVVEDVTLHYCYFRVFGSWLPYGRTALLCKCRSDYVHIDMDDLDEIIARKARRGGGKAGADAEYVVASRTSWSLTAWLQLVLPPSVADRPGVGVQRCDCRFVLAALTTRTATAATAPRNAAARARTLCK